MNLWYHFVIVTRLNDLYQWCYVRYLRHKNQVNVVFVATLLSQWKYQRVYELLKADGRFNTTILVAPMRHYENSEDYVAMKRMLDSNGVDYVDWEKLSEKDKNIRKSLRPDVMFYVQPYYHIYDKRVDSHSFKDKLICYSGYALALFDYDFGYDLEFHNRAWKVFATNIYEKNAAINSSLTHGRNCDYVGYINSDFYLQKVENNVWKEQRKTKKKIIWSPHFSIFMDSPLRQSNFLAMSDIMLSIAKKYKDSIQFAFKPHPKLQRELYMHPDWGKEKTDMYYNQWSSMENTQYVCGDFYDLFMTSDGMINDSASFTLEYLFSQKPAIFCFRDLEHTMKKMYPIGISALSVQYYGTTQNEIEHFIDDIILQGHDTKQQIRADFYQKYLIPPQRGTVSMAMYQSILKKLF